MVFDETSGAIEHAFTLLIEVYSNIKPGVHKMSVVSQNDVVSCDLQTYGNGTVRFLPGAMPSLLIDIVDQNVAFNGYSAFTLRSLLPEGIEEVRGWIITSAGIQKVSPDDLIDAYCFDTSTQKIISPKPNVRYSSDW